MLRHLKQRQQGGLTPRDFNQVMSQLHQLTGQTTSQTGVLLDYTNPVRSQPAVSNTQSVVISASNKILDSKQQVPKRIRGKRSSKPMMEKRRRARINECLETLKSYVLHDTINLSHLGIDSAASENQDEETIARTILKSSGLINRHRGRKNPNKLEKADILELTVDYVRRLHEQREQLMAGNRQQATANCRLTASPTTPICIATDLSLASTMPVPPPTPASLGCDNSTSVSSASMSPPQSCVTPSSESCSAILTRSCGEMWPDELALRPMLVRHQMALDSLPYFWSPNSDQRALCSTPAAGH